MYQAIVFLPLVGAILAGLIALAGARARYPGRRARAGGDDHAHAGARPRRARTHAARMPIMTPSARPSRRPPARARPS